MRSYQAARSLYSFLGFMAWCVIIMGALAAFGGGAATQAVGRNATPIQFFLAAAPGILLAMAGVFGLAMVQMGRTSVDGAEYAQQSLDVSRQQLEIAKQLLTQGKAQAASYLTAQASSGTTQATTDTGGSTSYANRPDGAPQPAPAPDATALPDPAATTPAPGHIAKSKDVALPPPSTEITYRNGQFTVAGEAFKTKGDAIERQKELLAIRRAD
jgi:hypothetical protein